MTKSLDEYLRVFSNYTDKELIAMAQPERSDKMERSELHALVQVISNKFDELTDLVLRSDEIESLARENECLEAEIYDLNEKIEELENRLDELEEALDDQ